MSETVFCPACGTRISARARFCPSCGARQDEFQIQADSAPAPASADTTPRDEPPPRAVEPQPFAAPPHAEPPPTAITPEAAAPPPPRDVPPPAAHVPPPFAPPGHEPPAVVAPQAAAPPPAEGSVLPRLRGDSVEVPSPPREAAPPPPPRVSEHVPEAPAIADAPPEYSQPGMEPPRVTRGRSMQERLGRVDPQAAELSGLLKERLAVPGLIAAAVAASVSAGIVLVAGLVIAVVTPDVSIVGLVGVDANIVKEAFRQAVGTVLTPMLDPNPGSIVSGSRRIHPLVLVLIPVTALALTTRWQLQRTEGAPALQRLGWALAIALPFGLWMLVFAIIGGNSSSTNIDVSVGNAFALGVLWGLAGGLIGAASTLPLGELVTLPAPVRTALIATLTTLRPLAALLITCTAIALVGWLVQVGANAGDVRSDRTAPTALIEEAFFAGEHGIHLTALAGGARFRADANGALGLPFPVERANDVPGAGGTFRIFAYNDVLPAYVLLPALVVLLGLVILAALYAGFAAARAVGATHPALAAAWGAITGPSWAIGMALLAVLAGGLYHGDADDASVFGVFLLGGAILGGAGGALSASGQSSAAAGEVGGGGGPRSS